MGGSGKTYTSSVQSCCSEDSAVVDIVLAEGPLDRRLMGTNPLLQHGALLSGWLAGHDGRPSRMCEPSRSRPTRPETEERRWQSSSLTRPCTELCFSQCGLWGTAFRS